MHPSPRKSKPSRTTPLPLRSVLKRPNPEGINRHRAYHRVVFRTGLPVPAGKDGEARTGKPRMRESIQDEIKWLWN